jgi:hypothetical protein
MPGALDAKLCRKASGCVGIDNEHEAVVGCAGRQASEVLEDRRALLRAEPSL